MFSLVEGDGGHDEDNTSEEAFSVLKRSSVVIGIREGDGKEAFSVSKRSTILIGIEEGDGRESVCSEESVKTLYDVMKWAPFLS
ncbi:unnamed protein product [Rhizophagus irregularis]|nr:unnamed protein product [Rhizophagus irregularis]